MSHLSHMRQRLLPCLLLAALPLLAGALLPASAQVTGPAKAPAEAPLRGPARLDKLFEKLKTAESPQAAQIAASDIERAFERSGSPTADLIYSRVKEAMSAKDFDLALDLLDYLVALRPDWAEPYHRRSVVHFLRKDQDAAFRDVRETLAREPRHYHALAGLGAMLGMMGDAKGAFRAYQKALEIHPFFSDLKESVEKMRPDVEGRPI